MRRSLSGVRMTTLAAVLLSMALLGCGGSSESGAPADGGPSSSDCLLDEGSVPPFAETLDEERAQIATESCADYFALALGVCVDGPTIVSRSFGFTGWNTYYDDDGAFLGVSRTTDAVSEECQPDAGSWPIEVRCTEARFEELICACNDAFDPAREDCPVRLPE